MTIRLRGHIKPEALDKSGHAADVGVLLLLILLGLTKSGGRGSRVWYWARTRDKASHDPIPIPLGYQDRNVIRKDLKGCLNLYKVRLLFSKQTAERKPSSKKFHEKRRDAEKLEFVVTLDEEWAYLRDCNKRSISISQLIKD
ncbi:hypothetical protein TNCV_2446561 [Trichonephila clavipes]|nr:hypothetical protein TNCV_2446561 [Trichonephila clavipes]